MFASVIDSEAFEWLRSLPSPLLCDLPHDREMQAERTVRFSLDGNLELDLREQHAHVFAGAIAGYAASARKMSHVRGRIHRTRNYWASPRAVDTCRAMSAVSDNGQTNSRTRRQLRRNPWDVALRKDRGEKAELRLAREHTDNIYREANQPLAGEPITFSQARIICE